MRDKTFLTPVTNATFVKKIFQPFKIPLLKRSTLTRNSMAKHQVLGNDKY